MLNNFCYVNSKLLKNAKNPPPLIAITAIKVGGSLYIFELILNLYIYTRLENNLKLMPT